MLMTLAFSEERRVVLAYRNKIIQLAVTVLSLLYPVWNEAAQNTRPFSGWLGSSPASIIPWTGTTFCGPGASHSGRGGEEKTVKDKGKQAITPLQTTTDCRD